MLLVLWQKAFYLHVKYEFLPAERETTWNPGTQSGTSLSLFHTSLSKNLICFFENRLFFLFMSHMLGGNWVISII